MNITTRRVNTITPIQSTEPVPCGEMGSITIEKEDVVNNPSHYTYGKYEVLDVIEDWNLGFHLGNCVKYVARCEHKGNKLQDLKKAQFYLNREIERLEQCKTM